MEIRPALPDDLADLIEIDATIESDSYLHIEQAGEGLSVRWNIEPRALTSKKVVANPIGDDLRFSLKQIVSGVEEGTVLMVEHDNVPVALLAWQPRPERKTVQIIDMRVDFDFRRQGLATALLFQLIQQARESGFRAAVAHARADNVTWCHLLLKCGFDLAGIDTRRETNHDLVSEATTLFWYATLN